MLFYEFVSKLKTRLVFDRPILARHLARSIDEYYNGLYIDKI